MPNDTTSPLEHTPEEHPPRPARPTRGCHVTRLLWLLVLASYAATLFAFVFPHDFRNTAAAYVGAAWTAFMTRTFLFHLGLLLLGGALLAAILRRWLLLLATVPLVLFASGPALWSYAPKRTPRVAGETITVMSVNLLATNTTTAPLIAQVRAARPDILLLVEYTPRWHQAFQDALAPDYPYQQHVIRRDSFGLALYSRRPFGAPVDMHLPLGAADTPQFRTVIQLDGLPVAFYGVHLMPPKGCSATIRQRREFADLLEQLRGEKLPVILCGDFNFTNGSAFADELGRLGLIDAHHISGRGRGTTWPMLGRLRYVPGVRIDHVFLSRELTSPRSRTGTAFGSDHRPILTEIGRAPGSDNQ